MRKPLPMPPNTILVPRRVIMEYNRRFVPNPANTDCCYHCPYYDHTLTQGRECMKEGNACPSDRTDLYLVPEEVGPELLMIKMELDS